MTEISKKKQKLRNIEYYNIQNVFDKLYEKSSKHQKFYKLYEIVCSRENILLAFRNIKKNKGSKTKGTDNKTIKDIEDFETEKLVEIVRNRLSNYNPKSVRRKYIPKPNGNKRPLGIPTIEDRLIQQCILQVLEPICEARFYNYNYGFRPNRSCKHAMARTYSLAQINHLHYCVDIDIKGFFDNVNHGKLLKQIWSIGIRDKRIIKIISKMLKAEIEGEGIPNKGTPQGGILSPLLANIVLNELDWWVGSQWDNIPTKFNYKQKGNKHVALRNTNLKEMQIVRYADDFKIFCRCEKDAIKIFHGIKNWIKERLKLNINEEKSKIVNLKKEYSEYLGIKFKVIRKNNKHVIRSHITEKATNKIVSDIKHMVLKIKRLNLSKFPRKLNSMIIGYHNYYNMATMVSQDFSKIKHRTYKIMSNKFITTKTGTESSVIKNKYGNYRGKKVYLRNIEIVPIYGVKFNKPMQFGKDICNYTKTGRAKIHENLNENIIGSLLYIMENPSEGYSAEYNDNRISLYSGQKGCCGVRKIYFEPWDMECHHKIPREIGGSDEYKNLIYIERNIHKLIHAKKSDTINYYMNILNLTREEIKRVNKLRKLANQEEILITN